MVRDRKYVVPFPNGISIPIEEFTVVEHNRKLSFPASYTPSIMSALKVLARPETYDSDEQSEINFGVQQGHDILGGVQDNNDCTLTPSNVVLYTSYAAPTYTSAFAAGTVSNHVSRYAFASISYSAGEPYLNQPRFHITSPGWINPGCTWDVTIKTRVPGRVFQILTQECGKAPDVETGVMDGYQLTRHYVNNRLFFMYVDVCDYILGLIDLSDVTCGDV